MLPEGWKRTTFGEVTRVASGQVDPTREPFIDMLHIGPEDIESNTGRVLEPKTCRELGLISGKYEFDERAVVYSKIRPHLNKVCFPKFKGLCSADAYPIWPDEKQLSAEYLALYMLGPVFEKRAVACSMRTGMPKINREDLDSIPIFIPPLAVQQSIAEILIVWDSAIQATGKLLANCRLQKQALMQQLLSGKKRLPGKFGAWKQYRLGTLFKERVETDREDLALLSITREGGVIPREDVGRKDTSNEDKSKYLRICPGDIGYNTMRMWQGVSALSAYEGIISPAYTVLIPQSQIDGRFAAYLFKFEPVVFLFYRYSQGLVSDTWNLKYPHFAEIKVSIPERKEQEAIADVLATADAEIIALTKELERLQVEKRALMQQLLTGKRRVRVPDNEAVEA